MILTSRSDILKLIKVMIAIYSLIGALLPTLGRHGTTEDLGLVSAKNGLIGHCYCISKQILFNESRLAAIPMPCPHESIMKIHAYAITAAGLAIVSSLTFISCLYVSARP